MKSHDLQPKQNIRKSARRKGVRPQHLATSDISAATLYNDMSLSKESCVSRHHSDTKEHGNMRAHEGM